MRSIAAGVQQTSNTKGLIDFHNRIKFLGQIWTNVQIWYRMFVLYVEWIALYCMSEISVLMDLFFYVHLLFVVFIFRD